MRHGTQIREEAIHLRKTQGLSLNELAEALGVSRSTIRYWVKDLIKPDEVSPDRQTKRAEKLKENQRAATAGMQAKCAALRQDAYNAAYSIATQTLQDQDIRDFVVLYLAEGYRKGRNAVALTNSNPHIVRFAHNCMRRLSTNTHFYYSFQYHADQDPETLKGFWAAYLGIDTVHIRPVRKTNSGHLKGRRFACQYGIFQIQVGDTFFRSRLQALMDAVQAEWAGRAG